MQKKKFDLTSDIVEVTLEEGELPVKAREQSKKKDVLLAIAVSVETRKEIKTWCAKRGLTMNEAMIKGFNLLKKQDYS